MADKDTPGGGPREITHADEEPIKLTEDEQKLLNELLDEAENLRQDMEAGVRRFGRKVLTDALQGDSIEAMAIERSKIPVVRELLRRAGGPTLRLSRKMVSVSIRTAGWEKALNDEKFRGLDLVRKQLLLPLKKAELIRQATDHIVDLKLTEDATEEYVLNLRKANGLAPKSRMTPRRARRGISDLTRRLTANRALPKILEECADLDDDEAKEFARLVADLQGTLEKVHTALKRRR